MKKALKMIGISILGLFLLACLAVVLFLNLSPQFGQAPTKERAASFEQLPNYGQGKFQNLSPSPMNIDNWKLIKEWMKEAPNRKPNGDIAVEKIPPHSIKNINTDATKLIWFGHSAFLLQIDGKNLLLDPMFGESPAPHPLLGPSRYSKELPIAIEQLPAIDAVILSHDHYDHLDYGSISKLKDKVAHFYTPLGLGSHLRAWGIPDTKITELNWWQESEVQGIRLACTPARHFSGRALFDRAATLWGSWVITGSKENIFFSGDGGYDTHFAEIGERYGPFDIALMECGQYNEDWKFLHMMPEETVQAAIDVGGQLLMPIHWGAFTLALHDWTDPVERASQAAKKLGIPITTPAIGQPIILGSKTFPNSRWWEQYKHTSAMEN